METKYLSNRINVHMLNNYCLLGRIVNETMWIKMKI